MIDEDQTDEKSGCQLYLRLKKFDAHDNAP